MRTRNNKDSTPITTTEETTKSSSKSAKKTLPQLNKKTQKPKLTAPSPSVVSQASSLPNAMPISLLTQFSVLLQVGSDVICGQKIAKNISMWNFMNFS